MVEKNSMSSKHRIIWAAGKRVHAGILSYEVLVGSYTVYALKACKPIQRTPKTDAFLHKPGFVVLHFAGRPFAYMFIFCIRCFYQGPCITFWYIIIPSFFCKIYTCVFLETGPWLKYGSKKHTFGAVRTQCEYGGKSLCFWFPRFFCLVSLEVQVDRYQRRYWVFNQKLWVFVKYHKFWDPPKFGGFLSFY